MSNGYPTVLTGTDYQIPLRSIANLNVTYGFLNPSSSEPGLVAFSADGSLLFEFLQEASRVDVYETQAMHLVRRINLEQASSVRQMIVDRDNKYLFLGDQSVFPGLRAYLVNPPSKPPLTFPAHSLA
ncbi:MAG: hypothetical protein DMF04_11815, partial [Verrucomicrobia bacterium]